MSINEILIIFVLFFTIKCESWWSEITAHNMYDNNGYSGSPPRITNDFYLCSERFYRLHFYGDDNKTWTEEFTACQPAGIDRYINGIAISGGCSYQVYYLGWSDLVEGYDITDEKGWLPFSPEENKTRGFAAQMGNPLCGYLVYGNEVYRSSDDHGTQYLCSNEKLVAERIIYNLFGMNYTFDNYDSEKKIALSEDKKISVGVMLLKRDKINFKGKITIKIENENIIKVNYGSLISEYYIQIINDIFDFDINNIKEKFENLFMKKVVSHGDIIINFNWPKKLIEINVASKIKGNFYGYRGGVRINIYLNNDDLEFFSKIKKLCLVFIRVSGKRISEHIKDILSNFNDFEKVDKVIKFLDIYSVAVEEVIFFKILSNIIKNN